ncbi:GPP34 family phosphoprotein [Dactylosporangium sp. NPDC000244]|uniref:GOLPH3/VPS74 family protein n=1 Tax=Dactylosporangium sp. NPDC000244 TaxID=3154365 RepID=UPI00331B7263
MSTPLIGQPQPGGTRHPLRVELFFIAHSDTGEPLVHPNALSIGLAAAILIDLLHPIERITVSDGGAGIIVGSRNLTGDPVADWAMRLLDVYRPETAIHEYHPSMTVRDALQQLATHAYQRTAAGLIAGDLAAEVTRRRRLGGKVTTYPPTDEMVISRVRSRLSGVLRTIDKPDPQTDALAGLIRALDLPSVLYLDGLGLDLRAELQAMLARVGRRTRAVRVIVEIAEALIAETAVSVYG